MQKCLKFFQEKFIMSVLLVSISLSVVKVVMAATPNPGHDFTEIGGGTVQGDILYGSSADTLSALAKNNTATRYLSNTGSSNNPAWAQIELSSGLIGYAPVDVQTFTNTGDNTWTKPTVGRVVRIQIWGAGGSGGRAGIANGGGGGGGGGYQEAIVALSTLSDTEICAVGTGGAAQTSDESHGSVGGNTTFDVFTAYGGGPGYGNTLTDGGGGGGGGLDAVGGGPTVSGGLGSRGVAAGVHDFLGGGGGGTTPSNGGNGVWGGGGGGYGQDTGTSTSGGKSVWGGGGGGGGDGTGTPEGSGGASIFGGAGGAGATGANAATAGTQPGGGGGGSVTGNSGAGGDGKCVITVF